MIGDCSNITNQHNRVGADIIRPQLCTIFKYSTLWGQPLRLSVIGEADTKPQLMIIYPLPSRPTIIKLLYSPRFGIFFFFVLEHACKRKANEPFPLDTRNAAPQYLACGSQSVARHIRAQTRRSLNECATSPKRRRWRMKRGDVGEKQGA